MTCTCGREGATLDYTDWWAVQEAARQCVAARLRTHVGGPTQTFAALEKALLAVNSSLRNGVALPGARNC